MTRKRSSIQRFEDLRVWQAARELAGSVYEICRRQPMAGDRGLVDQMTRAAVSVSSNIAEGHERGSRTEYIHFCYIAKGSAGELRSQMCLAKDVGFVDEDTFGRLYERCVAVSSQLASYIKHLQESAAKIAGPKFTREADRTRLSWDEFLEKNGTVVLPNGRHVREDSEEGRAHLARTAEGEEH